MVVSLLTRCRGLKSEARNPKSETNPNRELRMIETTGTGPILVGVSDFGPSCLFRVSIFALRTWPADADPHGSEAALAGLAGTRAHEKRTPRIIRRIGPRSTASAPQVRSRLYGSTYYTSDPGGMPTDKELYRTGKWLDGPRLRLHSPGAFCLQTQNHARNEHRPDAGAGISLWAAPFHRPGVPRTIET